MSICRTCSKEVAADSLFCGSCGSRVVPDAPGDETIDSLVGQTLNGTYFIEQKIGSGGMGDVYRGIHKKLESPVALKIVKPGLLAHSTMIHRFEREARAASKLHHTNIVAVTDFGHSENGMLFMVMEYVTGKNLARVIADDAPLPERRAVHIGGQILSALAEAHANGILHRDLKPENVMIAPRRDAPDTVKVLDFGIAKMLAVGVGASTLTQAGLVCGTPGYMSPEQMRGDEVDVRSDVFSFGVVLYEMLTQKLPFDAQTPMETLRRHMSERVPTPSQRIGRRVSPGLERLVLQALSPVRDERPASAEALREALLGIGLSGEVGDGDDEQGLATEVLPREASRSAAVPRRTTPPRSEGAPRATPPSSRTRDDATEGRKTPRAEGTRSRPGVPRRESRSGATASAHTPAPTFEKRLEDRVARLLGPVAPYLVKKASVEAETPHDLCQRVAEFIPSSEDRAGFLAWCSAELNAPATTRETRVKPPSAPGAARVTRAARAWDPAVLDRARRDLAVHLGPLAGIVVRRVSPRARDSRELYELLALEIPSAADRDAFRRLTPREAGGE
jgi:serine/threonine-protein kinase